MRCFEDVVCASTTSHSSLHFDGFMVQWNVLPECTAADFLKLLEQRFMDTSVFTIPFAVKTFFLHAAAARSRWPRRSSTTR